MDERIFDQLDRLQRGAQEHHDPQGYPHHSSTDFSAYDEYAGTYAQEGDYPAAAYEEMHVDYAEQPMHLDSFDQQLLRQPDHDSRHGQAALGRARLSLPPASSTRPAPSYAATQMLPPSQGPFASQRPSLSRFAYDAGAGSSPPPQQTLPSSRRSRATRPRPAPHDRDDHFSLQSQAHQTAHSGQSSSYQPRRSARQEVEGLDVPRIPHATAVRRDHALSRENAASTLPVVQGISLVSTRELPDKFRALFPFPLFNAIQSKCFSSIYKTNDNFVLSSPTGSGKTAVLELAICRLISGFNSGSFKIVYQAPTKSLCSERQRDWQAKFGPLDLQCAELTGDTDPHQIRKVQHASIIVTTPEKWDSVTRKWKDHRKLMQMVKLFLIDEVHILKEERGATLEAVVSRMKSVGSNVRFIALSATVPNSQDIATWLGKDATNAHLPAVRERFGEEFRPVRLQKHVCGYQSPANDFGFEKLLNSKLPEVIAKYSQRKPLMVFCFTRNSCADTAKILSIWWQTKGARERFWEAPSKQITVGDKDLRDTVSSGVAFHHAGLTNEDRMAVEKGYLEGNINVICCTSTLAVGVNLPCHMVIIKNTVTYSGGPAGGCKEYSDLEIMQMLGRAGRPQFDNSAVAVIMTRQQRASHYETMISGQEILESCLHRNLIDHLNAEIGLGTVTSVASAKRWLTGTFMYVRLKENPDHYKIKGSAPGSNLEEDLESICRKAIASLRETDLVCGTANLQCTDFGDAMARYYLQFETMKGFMELPPTAKISEMLSAISKASEFRDIRFKMGEKAPYKELNQNNCIKFPIAGNVDSASHKVSLIIQSVLGAIDFAATDPKHRAEYNTCKSVIFQHCQRLIRGIIDCQLSLEDSVSARNALMLARSFGAQVWDDSPLTIKQLEGVGLVGVRKLVAAGMKSIEDLESTEPHRIERALTRNPPYGTQLQEKARLFPRLRLSMKMVGEHTIKKGKSVTVRIKADIGFMNEKITQTFNNKPVYVCLLIDTSDGRHVHFVRAHASKLTKGQEIFFSADLTSSSQTLRGYFACEDIAGTQQCASLKPEIPTSAFPTPKAVEESEKQRAAASNAPNTLKRRAAATGQTSNKEEDFGDAGLDDADLVRAEPGGYKVIDDSSEDEQGKTSKSKAKTKAKPSSSKTAPASRTDETWQPRQLANGKWACNHACGDKTKCKHLCCREGLDKQPKPPKVKEPKKNEPGSDPKQTQLDVSMTKKSSTSAASAPKSTAAPRILDLSKEAKDLDRLHNSVKSSTPRVSMLGKGTSSGKLPSVVRERSNQLSFLPSSHAADEDAGSSDYGSLELPADPMDLQPISRKKRATNTNNMSDEMLDFLDDDPKDVLPVEPSSGEGEYGLSAYPDKFNADFDDGFPDIEDDYSTHRKQSTTGGLAPTQKDKDTLDASEHPAKFNHDLDNDFPDFDGDYDMGQKKSTTAGLAPARKGKSIFITGDSSDAFANRSPSLKPHDIGKHPYEDAEGSSYFAPSKKHKENPRAESSEPQTEGGQSVLPGFDDDNDFLREIAAAVPEPEPQTQRPADKAFDLEQWFKNEFGTENFNFVG